MWFYDNNFVGYSIYIKFLDKLMVLIVMIEFGLCCSFIVNVIGIKNILLYININILILL